MVKTNLPVILLRGLVLLPDSEIRLEFKNDSKQKLIEFAENYHENHVLVVSQLDPLEERPDVNDLPRIGVIGKIKRKLELANGTIRIVIEGLNRVSIFHYEKLNQEKDILEAEIGNISYFEISEQEERAYTRKLHKELEQYMELTGYVGLDILSLFDSEKDISKLSDKIAFHLPISLKRKQEYVNTISPLVRIKMLLEDLMNEQMVYELENKIENELREQIDNSQKEFILREKIKLIKEELGDSTSKDVDIETMREQIEKLKAPVVIKNRLKEELKRYETANNMSGENSIVRGYIDWLLNLPWNSYTKDNNDLKKARQILDHSHYGLEKPKERIIEYLAVKQMVGSLRGPILCLVGPPGTGKTSLAKSIATSVNRKFVKMSVGGVNDEAEIMGHRRTYLGANPGRIIQGLKKAGSSNPVFLIDEIDKLTKDIKGDPASALLEVLDPEQNKYFKDNYIEEEYDLSKVMFIATANYLEDIPEALRDRLEIIELSSYTEYEKFDIVKKYLLKKEIKEHGLLPNSVQLEEDAIREIIDRYTKEAGVRELERLIATIVRKVTTKIVMQKKRHGYKVSIHKKDLEQYLGKPKYFHNTTSKESKIGVVNGLAYTPLGGDILPIEVNFYKGNGELTLTGSLGDVMKESARIALSYIKANAIEFNIDYALLEHNSIHIHVPEGAIKKDGPSAGITLTTALISAFTKKPIESEIGMTGEITLRGDILPIGGLREKAIGAYRGGVKKIFLPKENERDIDELPDQIKSHMTFIFVANFKEVYKKLLK